MGREDSADDLASYEQWSKSLPDALRNEFTRGKQVVDLSGAFRLDRPDYPRWYGFEHHAHGRTV